jgi:hypothetical protein
MTNNKHQFKHMKISHLTISILIMSTSFNKAQEKPIKSALKQDTIKSIKKPIKQIVKISKKDSIKQSKKPKPISADYCPPCGRG